ncbi:MAG TPA: formyltetrahydrofolate deformylase [Kofleriaceae bacterium]|jgi:formyltetrahydrofolate deformylase
MSGAALAVGTLLVQSPHRKGIVTALSQLLSDHDVTVVDSSHFSDASTQMFFQRIDLDAGAMTDGARTSLERALTAMAEHHGMSWRIRYPEQAKRIAIMVSKQEHCLYDLLIRHRAGELPCVVAAVISNHPDAGPIAQHFDVPFHHLPVTPETKNRQESHACEILDAARVDLVVLARYMQMLTPGFVGRYPHRIINIHHSFLPAFVGGHAYRQAHEKGVKMIGATSHYVTADLDQGPIIEQATVRCTHRDSVDTLRRKGRDLETHVLATAVRLHLENRVMVAGGKTVVFD